MGTEMILVRIESKIRLNSFFDKHIQNHSIYLHLRKKCFVRENLTCQTTALKFSFWHETKSLKIIWHLTLITVTSKSNH